MFDFIIIATRHSNNEGVPLLLLFFCSIFGIIFLYALIQPCLDNLKKRQIDEAKVAVFSDFKKGNPRIPSEIVSNAKKVMNGKYNFRHDEVIKKYKHCYYMNKNDNFTYAIKSPLKHYEVFCTVRNCIHERKPRCEIHKRLDWELLRDV